QWSDPDGCNAVRPLSLTTRRCPSLICTMSERKSDPGRPSKKSFWILFWFGILIHLVAVNQPLIDAHLVRQAQTADWTYHALKEPGFPLSAEVSWRGDTHARLILEFPL